MTGTTADPKRPRTAPREARRQQLIEATIEAIARHGLTGATTATVTEIAGLSMGSVNFHFQSKEILLRETLVYLAEEHRECWVQRLADSALAPEAKLAAVVDAHFNPDTLTDARVKTWFAFFGESRHRKEYRAQVAPFDRERTAAVTELCETLMAGGEHHGVSADEIACNIESLADGLWLSTMLYPDWLNRDRARRQMHAYLQSVFPAEFARWPGETDDEDAVDLRRTGT